MGKVYHHRVRDGQVVAWSEDGEGRLRLLAPHDRVMSPQQVAVEVLADAIGRRRGWRLAGRFAAMMEPFSGRWDWRQDDLREWADHAERGGTPGEGD